YDSAWTLNLATATTMSLVLAVVAKPAAAFFAEPRVEGIVYWLALASVIGACANIGVVDFRKRLEFRREFAYLFSARVLSTAVTLVLAWQWREYWALVAGAFAQSLIRVALSYALSPYRPRLSRAGLRDIFGFSRWMLLQNVLQGLSDRASALAIGRLAGADALAKYNVAYEIANLATTELAAPIRRAMLPGFARMASDPRTLRDAFIRTAGVIVLVGLPIPIGIALTAPRIVDVLLGPKWLAAIPLMQVLALHGVLRAFSTSSHVVYLAVGKPRFTAIITAARLCVLVPALVVMTMKAGALGAAWATVIVAALVWILDYVLLYHVMHFDARALLGTMWRPVVAALVMALVVRYGETLLPGAGPVAAAAASLAALVALGALAYVVTSFALWRACLRPPGAESAIFGVLRQMRVQRS
ncbi:MAG TPA: oligosaccharide flippase family protein, partial [Casimicrobiaceae bacterium]|nr:oligosaccharide flippase family protein [Casimicrobiaceae bacterium]